MKEEFGEVLLHYGVSILDGAPGRGSGRYPRGYGENANQHSGDFLSRVDELRKTVGTEGYPDPQTGKLYFGDTAVAKALNLSTSDFRAEVALAKTEERSRRVAEAHRLRDSGLSLNEIAKKMGFENDSSVRNLLNDSSEVRMRKAEVTANLLRDMCDNKGMIDVGEGVEKELGISKEKLDQALHMLEMDGYKVYSGGLPQVTNPGQQTIMKVLCPPGTPHKDIYNYDQINSVKNYDQMLVENGSAVRKSFEYPASMDSSRLQIKYAEEGGINKDGLIELRRGVADLDLGDAHYAQVRILVDGTHYIKGMAAYGDNMPDGVDVIFNTNKHEGTPMEKVLKPIDTKNPDNPFGSLIKEHGGQSYYDDPNGIFTDPITGKKQSLSLINKRADEGDWGEWSKQLPSQFLAKQSQQLIDKQLKLSMADRYAEYEEIMSLTNPTVKRNLLYSYAEDCDSAAVHLKAAALPRQKYQVIFPLETIKDSEVYAPGFKNGEKVALIRFPHGGTFEIPYLTVNNKNEEAQRVLGTATKDVVGINSKVASQLSGADFDGDTVLVIPDPKRILTHRPALEGLKGFDPTEAYGPKDPDHIDYKLMTEAYKQKQMGVVSNLITDMTLRGATDEDLEKAVRHSMVVIDAVKHNLDYKRSEKENEIALLKRKYQTTYNEDGEEHIGGASTLLSRAKREYSVEKRQGAPRINEDGTLSYKLADDLKYIDPKTGKEKIRMQKSTEMAETSDARKLSSGTPQEEAYAEYANYMKSLANTARKEMLATKRLEYSPESAVKYKTEVDELDSALRLAQLNKPRERKAQMIANSAVKAKKQANPDIDKKELKKIRQMELTKARLQVGASRNPINISDKQWKAIQSGAISDSKLSEILKYADSDRVRELATPKTRKMVTDAKIARINAMKASGYTTSEIAEAVGVSASTVTKYL